MVRVILIRHGETDWNREQVFRGRMDVPLNERGRSQAMRVREALAQEPISAIYASPLLRALATAQVLAEGRNLAIEVEAGLSDIDFGLWQGVAKEKVQADYPDLYAAWMINPHLVSFPQGESLHAVQKRSMLVLERAIGSSPGGTIAVVSHRVVNKVIVCTILGLDLSRFWYVRQDTCAINRFVYEGGRYCLTLLNDTCHLKEIGGEQLPDF